MVSGNGSFVYMGGVPVFYWPTFTSDVTVPSFYVTGVKVKRDSIFGTQAMLDWDMFQLLGIDRPPTGTRWTLSTDYLSERGPALGSAITYNRPSFFGIQGPTSGFLDAWGIYDTGLIDWDAIAEIYSQKPIIETCPRTTSSMAALRLRVCR